MPGNAVTNTVAVRICDNAFANIAAPTSAPTSAGKLSFKKPMRLDVTAYITRALGKPYCPDRLYDNGLRQAILPRLPILQGP